MITVSIVTYRTDLEELGKCLASLRSDVVKRVYIIDNASEQRIHKFCHDQGDWVEYIANSNTGYGAGHNIALRKVIQEGEAEYHLVLNTDVEFDPSVLGILHRYMDENSDIGQVQPSILYPNGKLQYTVRKLPTPWDLIVRRFVPWGKHTQHNHRYTLRHIDHDTEFDVPYHQGCFMLIRVEALKEVGLFDERFFMYPEDIDLTRRIHRKYRTMYTPICSVVHAHRGASYYDLRMTWTHIVNICRYFNKWGWIYDRERSECNRKLEHLAQEQQKESLN